MSIKISNKAEAGFTLVELAIVLMIIALLIGGILFGKERMENGHITSTIQQTKAYEGAATTFNEAYGALPGDIKNPGDRLANCTSAPCNIGGDGNGIITGPKKSGIIKSLKGSISTNSSSENRQFWSHLAATHLITAVNPSPGAVVAWGVDQPAAKSGGGFQVGYADIAGVKGGMAAQNSHFLILKNTATSGDIFEKSGLAAISPMRAAQFDSKLDDGLPQTGDVIAVGSEDCTGAAYKDTVESRDCNLLIRVQN